MKENYQQKIEESKLKLELLKKGLKSELYTADISIDRIQDCLNVINQERRILKMNEELLAQETSGQLERRNKAKQVLGIV